LIADMCSTVLPLICTPRWALIDNSLHVAESHAIDQRVPQEPLLF
jgi:hypothetical protein